MFIFIEINTNYKSNASRQFMTGHRFWKRLVKNYTWNNILFILVYQLCMQSRQNYSFVPLINSASGDPPTDKIRATAFISIKTPLVNKKIALIWFIQCIPMIVLVKYYNKHSIGNALFYDLSSCIILNTYTFYASRPRDAYICNSKPCSHLFG